jgi:hypothetical protein
VATLTTAKLFSETRPRGTWVYRVKSFKTAPASTSPYSNEVSLRVR